MSRIEKIGIIISLKIYKEVLKIVSIDFWYHFRTKNRKKGVKIRNYRNRRAKTCPQIRINRKFQRGRVEMEVLRERGLTQYVIFDGRVIYCYIQ